MAFVGFCDRMAFKTLLAALGIVFVCIVADSSVQKRGRLLYRGFFFFSVNIQKKKTNNTKLWLIFQK